MLLISDEDFMTAISKSKLINNFMIFVGNGEFIIVKEDV